MMAFYNWNILTPSLPLCTYIVQPPVVPLTLQIAAPAAGQTQTPSTKPRCEEANPNDIKQEPADDEEKKEDKKDWSVCDVKEEPDSDVDFKLEPNRVKRADWTEVLIKEEFEESNEKIECKSKNGRTLFKCDFCAYTTNWKGNLTKHLVSRHTSSEEINWLQCDLCSYKGKTKDYLKCHLLHVHNISVKWFNCSQCSFKAKSKSLLKRHTIVNHTESEQIHWYNCANCPYRAKQKTSLKDHILNKHTNADNIKWYQCDWCDFIAKRKRNLKLHQLNKHTDKEEIQWFKCDQCSYKFKRKSALQAHVSTSHRSVKTKHKPETREIPVFINSKLCWKRIVVSEDSSGDHAFKCVQCDFSNSDKEIFKKHVLKMHTVTEIREKPDGIVKKTYTTKNVVVLVDDVPCVRRVIDHPLTLD